jgi:hypothetical protein
MCHLLEDTAPSAVGKTGTEDVTYGQQLQNLVEHLPLTGVDAGIYVAR